MGRNKSEKFVQTDDTFYMSGKRHFDVYVGNQISGIYDKRIPASDKLFSIIRGFLDEDPHMLIAKYNLFGLIGKKVHYVKAFNRLVDKMPSDPDVEAVFAVVSDTQTIGTMPVYALFYIPDVSEVLEKPSEENGSASDVLWLLNFFKKHSKHIAADDDEIKQLKKMVIRYVKRQ